MQSYTTVDGSHQGTAVRLREQVQEYERIIASFETTNENLRARRVNAPPQIVEFCDRHLALNTRALEAMRNGLRVTRQQLKEHG